jgi:hypothetical protein
MGGWLVAGMVTAETINRFIRMKRLTSPGGSGKLRPSIETG